MNNMSNGTKQIRSGRIQKIIMLLEHKSAFCGDMIDEFTAADMQTETGIKIAVLLGKQSAYLELIEELKGAIE